MESKLLGCEILKILQENGKQTPKDLWFGLWLDGNVQTANLVYELIDLAQAGLIDTCTENGERYVKITASGKSEIRS